MVYFMNYGDKASFNNIQLMLFAFVTLWITLSRLIWTVHVLRNGQYRIKR